MESFLEMHLSKPKFMRFQQIKLEILGILMCGHKSILLVLLPVSASRTGRDRGGTATGSPTVPEQEGDRAGQGQVSGF